MFFFFYPSFLNSGWIFQHILQKFYQYFFSGLSLSLSLTVNIILDNRHGTLSSARSLILFYSRISFAVSIRFLTVALTILASKCPCLISNASCATFHFYYQHSLVSHLFLLRVLPENRVGWCAFLIMIKIEDYILLKSCRNLFSTRTDFFPFSIN